MHMSFKNFSWELPWEFSKYFKRMIEPYFNVMDMKMWTHITEMSRSCTFCGSMEAVTKIAAEECFTSSFNNLARVALSGRNAETGTSWPKPIIHIRVIHRYLVLTRKFYLKRIKIDLPGKQMIASVPLIRSINWLNSLLMG